VSTGRENQQRGEAERQSVAGLFRAAGFVVVNLSQPGLPRGVRGRRGTFQTPGIPDLRVYDPRGLVPPIWVEVKSGKAKPTAAQYWFARLAATNNERWIAGGVERAKEHLRAVGCLQQRADGEVLVPLRGTAVA
jgi:hypothetical protein